MEGSETSSEMDWSDTILCLKCNEGENLLLCCQKNCPVAIHRGCMACPARFDDAGNFYCPYCMYQKAVAELRQKRKYALARKKDLLIFTSGEKIGVAKDVDENEGDETNGHDRPICDGGEGKKCNRDCIADQLVHPDEKERHNQTPRKEKIKKVGSEEFASSSGLQRPLNVTGHEIHNSYEENFPEPETNSASRVQHAVEEEIEASSGSEGQNLIIKRHKKQNIDHPRVQELSLIVYQTAKKSDPRCMDFEDVLQRSKHLRSKYKTASPSVDPLRRSISQLDTARGKRVLNDKHDDASTVTPRGKNVLNDKHDASTSSEKPPQPSSIPAASHVVNHVDDGHLFTRKSKRTRWRSEEEEMLKRGVMEFSEANRNIPWRKILGYGRDVFDENRSPSDLKEKWKTLSKSQIKQVDYSASV